MKILWLTNIPSPYRVDFFNELGKSCDLTVLFERRESSERDESWKDFKFKNFSGILLNGINTRVDSALCLDILKYLKKDQYDHIVVTNFSTLTGILAINYMKFKQIQYLIESDGGFPKSGKGIKEVLKKSTIKGAKGYFSTANIHDEYYLMYGANRNEIYRYPFTSLKEVDLTKKSVDINEKNKLKEKLNLKEDFIVISIGSLIHRKGFDVLIKSAKKIDVNSGIYIIGGEPDEEYRDLISNHNLTNVHFVKYQLKEQLKDYFNVADLFVLPTREDIWGLVINESMAYGLPVITTDRCVAGLELIEDGINGYIVPAGNEDILSEKINYLIENEHSRLSMSNNNKKKIKNYTIEEMAKRHMSVFEEINRCQVTIN